MSSVVWLPVPLVLFDAERFQFKLDVRGNGTTRALDGVRRWNEHLSGIVLVWEDEDGCVWVVNGHHRLALARRLGVELILCRSIEAETAREARTIGALTNVAEGHGTVVDAAKLFRDEQLTDDELRSYGVSLTAHVAKHARMLADLHPTIFRKVATGKLTWKHVGVGIGGAELEPEQQLALLELVEKEQESQGRTLLRQEIEALAKFVKQSGVLEETNETLFGSETVRRSLAVPKAKLAAFVRRRLRRDKVLFRHIERGAARIEEARAGEIDRDVARDVGESAAQIGEVFDRLVSRAGPVSDALNRAAERLESGEPEREVQEELIEAIMGLDLKAA